MKPIIMNSEDTLTTMADSYTNGLGRLNALTAVVTEERNGIYELEMTVFIDDEHFSDLSVGSVLKVMTANGLQLFRVYEITKPMNGVCAVYAQHISYDLAKAPVLPFSASSAASAVSGLVSHLAVDTYEFTATTDIDSASTFSLAEPKYFRECLGGYTGSILDVYGGEYEFDNLTVKLLASRGSDNGVQIRYGKNMTDIQQESNIESMYTAVLGYATVDDSTVYGTVQYITTGSAPNVKIVDFSDEYESGETPTADDLDTLAQNYIAANDLATPKVNIEVSFVALADTEQYKDIAPLETVNLCDTVHVYFEKLGIDASAKVIKTEYDSINERLISVEVGDARTNLSESLSETVASEAVAQSSDIMTRAIEHATNMITGGLGGYVVIGTNSSGEPEEILIMDTNDKSTATNVIRMNQNGIGFSNDGYDGTYTTAWTIDGGFVADFITSGTINAITIEGSTIKSGDLIWYEGESNEASIDSGYISYNGTTYSGICLSSDAVQINCDNGIAWMRSGDANIYAIDGTAAIINSSGAGFSVTEDGAYISATDIDGSTFYYRKVGWVEVDGTWVLGVDW